MFKSLSPTTKGYLLIHVCVLLWGFTPIMGRLITLDALALVWWRMLIAAAVLLFVPAMWRHVRHMPLRLVGAYAGIGVILAITWVLFYLAVKLTDASVAAICLGTAPLFLALAEPVLMHRAFSRSELILAVLVIPGVGLVVGGIPHGMDLGFGVGLLSAAFLAAFSSLNKAMTTRAHPVSVTCIELGAGAVFLTIVTALLPHADASFVIPDGRNLILLLVFAVVLTVLPIMLMLFALRHISAFAQQMATNLEPVYAVLLAIPILGEQRQLDPLFYVGVVVIAGAVMAEPLARSLRTYHAGGRWPFRKQLARRHRQG